jgi:antitoxin component of MazEF toxin-antitoxin module
MRVTIDELDGSLAVRIPAALAAELGLTRQSTGDLRIENRRLVLVPSAIERNDGFSTTMPRSPTRE